MDTIAAIRTLRVVREYASRPLTEEELRAIADNARKAGSSKNTQRLECHVEDLRARLRSVHLARDQDCVEDGL